MVDEILEEMKNEGYKAALIRKDGQLFKSNFQFEDPLPAVLSSLLNVSDAMLKQAQSQSREVELGLSDSILVALPVSDYYLISYIPDRDKKKVIRTYAEKIKTRL